MSITKPWLLLPAHWAHKLSPIALSFLGKIRPYQTLTWSPKTWRNLEFTNPVGIAGGVDKNLENIKDWWTMGVGFIEVGTVTPRQQSPNPGQTLLRSSDDKALWNKLGFPNKGCDNAISKLKNLYKPHFTPIFVNIGKNRNTPNEDAHKDYIECIQKIGALADVFVINISSPNTKGLRDLFSEQNLEKFLQAILNKNSHNIPILLKLSPDLSEVELETVINTSHRLNVDGWILTNTTTDRKTLDHLPKEGGVSGEPLKQKSTDTLKKVVSILGERKKDKLIVSAGGVMNYSDVKERLSLGADLVQVYSAIVFEGPFFFRNLADKNDQDN